LALFIKVDHRTKENTASVITKLLDSISNRVHTITSDNGEEYANREIIALSLNCVSILHNHILPGKKEQMKIRTVSSANIPPNTKTLKPLMIMR
jgi:hypothetical protein